MNARQCISLGDNNTTAVLCGLSHRAEFQPTWPLFYDKLTVFIGGGGSEITTTIEREFFY